MATFKEIIELVDESRPNVLPERLKFRWLADLDGKIATDVMQMSIKEIREQLNYKYPDAMENELLVEYPHEDVYRLWLQAQIDFEHGDYDKYQNSMQAYNAAYVNFVHFFATEYERCHRCHNCNEPPYYLTAYGLAVKAGYRGTLEEWLESLKGKEGDAGVSISEAHIIDDELKLYFTDGTSTSAGKVVGKTGVGIQSVKNIKDNLHVFLTDGTRFDLGRIVGKSAYDLAVEVGYQGTEDEFSEMLAQNAAVAKASVKDGVLVIFCGTAVEIRDNVLILS